MLLTDSTSTKTAATVGSALHCMHKENIQVTYYYMYLLAVEVFYAEKAPLNSKNYDSAVA
jgi:hypothetical protein